MKVTFRRHLPGNHPVSREAPASGARTKADARGAPEPGTGERTARSTANGALEHRTGERAARAARRAREYPSGGGANGGAPAPRPDHEAVVVGMGAFSPLGRNCAEMRRALLDGRDSIAKVTHFDACRFIGELASSFGEDVPVETDADARSWMDRATLLTIEAYREAIRHAGVNPRDLDPERVGVCLGSSHSGLVRTEEIAGHVLRGQWERIRRRTIAATLVSHCTSVVKRMCGARGRVVTVSSACASSNTAVGVGADLIRRGELDLVVAGGSDTVSLSVMAGFNALRVISSGKTAPFSNPPGLNLGEGAGIVVLKRGDLEVPGCGPPLAEILGYGLSGDAWHATAPDPDGTGCERAMAAALDDGGLTAADIDYINAHGTGTEANDAAESRSLRRIFGDSTPVSSIKSFLGHTLGASGALELIASLLLAGDGVVPHGLRMDAVREECAGLDYVRGLPRYGRPGVIMVNNFGFGGNNSSLVVRAGSGGGSRRPRPRRSDAVVVTGTGIVSAAGAGVDRFRRALEAGIALARRDPESGVAAAYCPRPRAADLRQRRLVRGATATRHAILALGEALGDDSAAYDHQPRSGLVGGVVFSAQKPTEKYMESVFADPAFASAHYFPMTTMNATPSACSLAFGITGYTTTVCGAAAGLAYASDLVREGRQDRAAMVSADELSPRLLEVCRRAGVVRGATDGRRGRAGALGEFAAALTLERAASARERGLRPVARLAGWAHFQDPVDLSVARDGACLRRAIDAALGMSGVTPSDIGLVSLLDRGVAPARRACRQALNEVFGPGVPPIVRPDGVFGFAPSCGAAMAVATALVVLRSTDARLRHVLAAGFDLIGDGFAFILERDVP